MGKTRTETETGTKLVLAEREKFHDNASVLFLEIIELI